MKDFYFVMGIFDGKFGLLTQHPFVTLLGAETYVKGCSPAYGAFVVKQVQQSA